ncbi:MAG: DUF5723 family protein [Flavipsychrobacter sp.]
MRKLLLVLTVFLSIPLAGIAQRYFGIATGNWSGTNSLYLNPANIADSRDKIAIDIFSVNAGIDNNLGGVNFGNAIKNRSDSNNLTSIFNFGNRANFSMLAPYAEIRLPGIMVSINHKHSLALTARIRGMDQFNNFSTNIFRSIIDESYKNSVGDYALTGQHFNWTLNTWSEIGLTYGGVLFDNGKNQIKGGLSLRYLSGIAYISLVSKNLDAHYYSANDSLVVRTTDLAFASNIITTEDQLSHGITNSDLLNNFFGSKGGHGIGADVGFVYEYRPDYDHYRYDMDGEKNITDYSKNMYKFRLSVAVTDIGSINYNTGNKVAHLTGNGTLAASNIKDSVQDYNSFVNYASRHGFAADSSSASASVHLPTTLVLGFDYKIYRRFYANLTYVGNLVNRDNFSNSYYNQLTLTPRYDTRLFSVGLPITYSWLTQSMKLGLGVRFSGFFIGSDDMLAMFSNSQYGANVYAGAFVPIAKRKPKDRDHDHVSDRRDQCPDVPGTWALRGCPNPDRDHDGILDSVDKCPDLPGAPTAMGCPDADLDSVADDVDKCPDMPGLVSLQGCPDRDKDGVADNEDECPDEPGVIALHGCPDTDGDGVPDKDDRCPKVPGPESNHGCPVVKVQVKEEVKKRLAFAATAIQFETGKATIKKISRPLLNEIVKILNDYPDYDMTIDGYTDNVGKPEKNLQLSKDRANAVRNYFISQGIKENRLIANGYGETHPVTSNKTAAGRAKNRRVAMDLKLSE